MSIRSGSRMDWKQTPEKEASRKAREDAAVIVKVIIPIGDTEATIYREGRHGLRHQVLSDSEMNIMGGDRIAYFSAKWSNSEVKWVLLGRAPKKDYPW